MKEVQGIDSKILLESYFTQLDLHIWIFPKKPVWSYDPVGHKPLKQGVKTIGEKRKKCCTKKPCETWQKSHGKSLQGFHPMIIWTRFFRVC